MHLFLRGISRGLNKNLFISKTGIGMAFLLKCVSRRSGFIGRCGRRYISTPPISLSQEVRRAKESGEPIVALESTIITHGMPYPENLNTALEVENIIRDRGAVPATIAILKGELTVGLSEEQIRYLAQAEGVVKASRRDLAPVVAERRDGATTVAGTIIAADLADIPVFVTGGIGGVHRDGEVTMDVSADLNELGRSKTLVVCSGVKSILDIGRTLEYLETQGVCVCAFGDTDDFPAFYTQRSGHRAPHRVSNATEAARLLLASCRLGLRSGIVVAVPVPKEHAMNENEIEAAISKALMDSKRNGIHGKEVTPFILSAVARATAGASLAANIALIKNNAKVGADIAVEFKKIRNVNDSKNAFNIGPGRGGSNVPFDSRRHYHTRVSRGYGTWVPMNEASEEGDDPLLPVGDHTQGDVLVIGGANVDRTYRNTENIQLDGSTHPCETKQCGGGVGRNIAEALWRLRGGGTRLLTAIGDDADGKYLTDIAPGLILDGCVIKDGRTASYAAVLDPKGECMMGLGDMTLHNHITVDLVNNNIEALEQAPLVVLDGNIPQQTIHHVLELCDYMQKPVFYEPTDRRKATKPLAYKNGVTFSSPNINELRSMALFLCPNLTIAQTNDWTEILKLSKIVSQKVHFIIVTLGAKGVLTIKRCPKKDNITMKLYPVTTLESVINVSGAGDCFASGFITGMLLGCKESQNVFIGFNSAEKALQSANTVPPSLTNNILIEKAKFLFFKS